MRIAAVQVESYDGLHNRREEFELPPEGGLVVLEGPNEAGKTTMLRFIQALLFGNGELHGALILDQEGRRYSLRQSGRRQTLALVELTTGTTLDSTKLKQMLGGLDAKVYRSVFAFGLDELQQLQFLAASGIQEHIFSASVAGAGRNARKALTRIDGELKELLKPRARAVLNDLADELAQAKRAVRDAWQANQAYEELKRQEVELLTDIGREDQGLQAGEATQRQLEAIIELWPAWSSALTAARELESLEVIDGVPSDSLALFDVETRRAAEHADDIAARAADLDRQREELAAITVDSDLRAIKEQIEERSASLGVQQQRLAEGIPSLEDALERQRQLLDEQLQQIEGNWDEQRLVAAGANAAPPERLQVDERLLIAAGDIDELNANLSAYALRQERCAAVNQQVRDADRQLKVVIGQLGSGWGEQEVAGFNHGPNWRQKATEAQQELTRLARSRDQLEAHYRAVQIRLGEAEDRLAELPAPQREQGELESSRQQLEAQLQGCHALQARLAERTQKTQALQAHMAGVITATAEASRGRPLRWAGPVVGALGLLAAAYFSFSTNELTAYILAALALAVLIVLWPRVPRTGTRPTATVEDLEQRLDAAQAELARLDEQVRTDLASLSLAVEPGSGEMQALLSAAQRLLIQTEANLVALEQHARARASVGRLAEELSGARRELVELGSQENAVRVAWLTWCAERSIPDSVSPDGLAGYLARVEEAVRLSSAKVDSARELVGLMKPLQAYEAKVEQLAPRLGSDGATDEPGELVATWKQRLAREQERKRELEHWHQQVRDAGRQLLRVKQVAAELGELTGRSHDWEAKARSLLQLAGRADGLAGLELLAAVRELNADLHSAEADASRAAQLQATCQEHEVALEAMRVRQEKCEQAADAILAATGADDRSDLERRLAVQERREELQQLVRDAENQLTARFGQHQDEARAVLAEADPIGWSSRRSAAEAALRERAERLNGEDGLRTRRATAVAELQILASSSDIAERSAQLASLQQELRAEARNWLVRKLAEGMIADNLKEYERTHVPDVLKHASEKLSAVTGGRYVRIHNTQSSALRVFSSDDQVLDAAQLSRGTQEQLYLAVRLGLIDHFAKQSGKLPLVMDDVLVNADPERAVELANILAEAASRHQIIYLTCHPHTAELLRDRVPGCSYVKLERLVRSDSPRLTG